MKNRHDFLSIKRVAFLPLLLLALAVPAAANAQDAADPDSSRPTPDASRLTSFDMPRQELAAALNEFSVVTEREIVFDPELVVGLEAPPLQGDFTPEQAIERLLTGTGLQYRPMASGAYAVVDPNAAALAGQDQNTVGQRRPGIEEIIVTGQKREERIQDVPIAISAFTQEDLTTSQIAGGPDLHLQVPNMTFTKTNFTGYSIQIRGIGTQAISATTDPAVAVAMNNTPFIRNRFFEQEFYDLERLEVLRGPQGTLYGRNATAGVVNLITNKPTFEEEAMFSVDYGGNYNSRRYEGMVNIPLAKDRVALRLAGAATTRDGYATNEITGNPIDGRDLWSTRASLRVVPTDWIDANLIWEHFEEDDDRLRSGKQLCHRDDRTSIQGFRKSESIPGYVDILSQGCLPHSLYSEESFEVPDGDSLPYYAPFSFAGVPVQGKDPYTRARQSSDLRVIESTVDPEYRAETDIVELQLRFDLTGGLTLESETAWLQDSIFSLQDFNRFNTSPGAFGKFDDPLPPTSGNPPEVYKEGENGNRVFCDPQIGCADRLVGVDVSSAESEQFSQELRLASQFDGPFNFSLGANYLTYDTVEKFYVFVNTLTQASAFGILSPSRVTTPYVAGEFDNRECIRGRPRPDDTVVQPVVGCIYIDPNPIGNLNDQGHNYFLSLNPYELTSYAAFGEAYWDITDTLKLTAGLRYTVDKKDAPLHPSWLFAANTVGHPVAEVIEQEWREPTGRLTLDWQPVLDFTDETLLYASYARGYKAGGANPPISGKTQVSAVAAGQAIIEQSATKPKTFDAEFVNAFELGTKNTLLDGNLTLNLAAFYYDYKDYQISQIIDRSARNFNFDTEVWGAEIEADWWALENWRLAFKGGYQNTRVADGERAVDIMDRTAGRDGWVVSRPFPTFTENCVLPVDVFARNRVTGELRESGALGMPGGLFGNGQIGPCEVAYQFDRDPLTFLPYEPFPTECIEGGAFQNTNATRPCNTSGEYAGINPEDAPNNGEGFYKDLGGNELPNAPNYTMTLSTDYIVPLKGDWLMTLHADLYHQTKAWTRIFNMESYDRLKPYTTVNFAAIFANETSGWNVMAYIKNVFDRDAITGAFLFSDDVGLTTNTFLTEPRLFGIRVTKHWGDRTGERPIMNGLTGLFGREPDEPSPFSWEIGGLLMREDAPYETLTPESVTLYQDELTPKRLQNRDLDLGEGGHLTLTYSPHDKNWFVSSGVRFGKARGEHEFDGQATGDTGCDTKYAYADPFCDPEYDGNYIVNAQNWANTTVRDREEHLLVDFEVGRDVGLGWGIESRVGAGLRYAEFKSKTQLISEGIPDWEIPDYDVSGTAYGYYSQHHFFDTDMTAEREFQGVGPMLSWDASKRLLGDDNRGSLHADWSLSGGVLFGKQETSFQGREVGNFYDQKYFDDAMPEDAVEDKRIVDRGPDDRSASASVPTVGASLGLSYRVDGVHIGAGYRWERYYGVLDGGWDEKREVDRTTDGLYLKVTFGVE